MKYIVKRCVLVCVDSETLRVVVFALFNAYLYVRLYTSDHSSFRTPLHVAEWASPQYRILARLRAVEGWLC